MRHLPAAVAVITAALVLTACGTSVHHASRPSAGQCAQVETAVRQAALVTSHFTGVTTAHGLATALKQLAPGGGLTASSTSYLVEIKSRTLTHEFLLAEADYEAFWAAVGHVQPRPEAVAAAAQKAMRDIRAIRATCRAR